MSKEDFHSHFSPKNWDIKPAFKNDPAKGKSKVFCLVCGEFLGMKPGATYFQTENVNWKGFFGNNKDRACR